MSGSIKKGAAMLGAAGVIEYGLQLLLPVILVRSLTAEAFGDYRLVWLLATTALAIFPLFIPGSLFHFLPRASPGSRAALMGNSLIFVVGAGAVAGLLLVLAWSWMPASIEGLRQYSGLAPVFLALWVGASLLDVLPTADGNARWQAMATVSLALVRTLLLGATAWVSSDAHAVLVMMCVFALVKLLLVPVYAARRTQTGRLRLDAALLSQQIRYSLPFAVGNAFFQLRVLADQWIVASFFPSSIFALISIAGIALAISSLVRLPLNNATLPRLSGLLAEGRRESAIDLLAKSYSALSLVLIPALGLFFVTANEMVEIIYTQAYSGAAPMMQIYLVGQMACVFAAGHLLIIMDSGRLSWVISAVSLVVSIVVSLLGVRWLGANGAVAGSVVSLVFGEIWALVAVTRKLGTTIPTVVNGAVAGRVAAVVCVAVLVSLLLRQSWLAEMQPWARLAAVGVGYVALVTCGAWVARLHVIGLPLLASLLGRGGSR